jgi:1,4-dihydroxy-2-naphthoate octaprenyltransferase
MLKYRNFFSFIRPIQLVIALLEYGLGLALARYLGATILPEPQFLLGAIIILILTASNLLIEYFRPINEPILAGETRIEKDELRNRFLMIIVSLLTLAAVLIFLLQKGGFFSAETIILLTIFILLAMAIAIPPARFVNRGLGELSSAILIAGLIPSLSFLFQYGRINRVLTIFTIPFFMLALAYFLALNFPAYADDLKYERRSLLMSITWQRAVPLHNTLIVAAYLFFAAIPFWGIPFGLVWPVLLTLPLGGYQVYSLRNLADGAKPNWSVFIASATAIYGLTVYLSVLTFWLR